MAVSPTPRPRTPLAGGSITRSTIWNFLGVAAPVPVALLAIPALIGGMGAERFGVLTIAWALMGYFGVFDFGLSRATTSYLARACHDGDDETARRLFWSSSAAHLALGVAGGVLLLAVAPFVERMLSVGPALRGEVTWALYLLALSVPVVVLTSVMRGLLEALHRFDLVNAVKIPASMITYLGPLAALAFTQRLPPVIAVILVARALVLATYIVMCFRVMPSIRSAARPRIGALGPLIAMGGWISVGTVVTPVLASVDRFVIGSAVSAAAVTVYAAPYEVVTKLWMFSGSLMGVLFPRFSILADNRHELRRLYRHSLVALLLSTTPVAGLMVVFAPEFLHAWLGADIARDGVTVARWLTVGVLINVIAQAPYTALQATGHAGATGKLQAAELLLYVSAVWFVAANWGTNGVAIAWTARAVIDAVLMFAAASHLLGPAPGRHPLIAASIATAASGMFMIWCWHGVSLLTPALLPKAFVACVSVGVYVYAVSRGMDVSVRHAVRLLRADS